MGYVQGARTFSDYTEAEKFCDGWAGDTEAHVAVVEDFDEDMLRVMSYTGALTYIGDHDAQIQYDADYRPEDQRERDDES